MSKRTLTTAQQQLNKAIKEHNDRERDKIRVSLSKILGCEVVAEYQFHVKRKWRFDYAIINLKIAIEVEGGVWVNGRHTRGAGFLKDMEKYNTATSMGWHIIRTIPYKETEMCDFVNKLIDYKSKMLQI